MWGEKQNREIIGNSVPRVDADKNLALYRAYSRCLRQGLIASAQSVGRGGLAAALARTAMGGMLGLEIELAGSPGGVSVRSAGQKGAPPGKDGAGRHSPTAVSRDDHALFSESQGRMVVTIAPGKRAAFEKEMEGLPHALVGTVIAGDSLTIRGLTGRTIVKTTVEAALRAYRETFQDY
jgi:phosphoribosylformylglycinamidine synthase